MNGSCVFLRRRVKGDFSARRFARGLQFFHGYHGFDPADEDSRVGVNGTSVEYAVVIWREIR